MLTSITRHMRVLTESKLFRREIMEKCTSIVFRSKIKHTVPLGFTVFQEKMKSLHTGFECEQCGTMPLMFMDCVHQRL